MYLIFTNDLDHPTNQALKWFQYFNKKALCVKNEEKLNVYFSDFLNPEFRFKNHSFSFKDIKGVWFRRSTIKIQYDFLEKDIEPNMVIYHQKFREEIEDYLNYLFYNCIKSIGNPDLINVNKLKVLLIAQEVGLKIPHTLLADSDKKESLQGKNMITKLLIPLPRVIKEEILNPLTYPLKEDVTEDFTLSLFQERIEKRFEVRVFYLKGKFYAKAIFSQKDSQTIEDYRNYNITHPNRIVPFQLPVEIERKTDLLMRKIGLDTGSLDFIVDKKNQFVFLEVNPVGQFGDHYYQVNEPLEKEVVKSLL